jgi:hypothetical protein
MTGFIACSIDEEMHQNVCGEYSLTLFCYMGNNGCQQTGKYFGQGFGECVAQARSDGWAVRRSIDRAQCPTHSRKKRKNPTP